MHGVPSDLPLAALRGCHLDYIGLGRYQLQFHFSGDGGVAAGNISVEGHWEIHARDGSLVDAAEEPGERQLYRIHLLLGASVADFRIDAPRSFALSFDSGHTLTIFDDNPHYETFSVCLAGHPEIYV